ncbi:MAG TPA: bifunctional 3,4-dihydroxy-2-butanone-4-phosphate synthase/GTP cyclohydrolase II [Candidatus Kapabacteria bacterium]|nr:bifunctional 3,4-dihydroxy-2-butanone-4-phosphate synthase/GTP cyclohydrolase II [Candidatus Kapabacteria bacterium]HOV92230.1 bifunctional 3,4-dihydroxy-2-butanone-4-phosphate synthase/GTP cyclohydrolase II [Candidatus Kapabacteria bacterium]
MNTIEEAIEDLKNGKMVIVMDDEDRENEGDLIAAGEFCTAETINFMATKARGLICVSITEDRAVELELDSMVESNSARHGTRFTVSVDYANGTSSGISAYDRAATVRALADLSTKPSDLLRPGHIFPLIARRGGVLRRAGHTEGSVDIMRIAGLKQVGVLCEIMNEDGTMARRDDLEKFAEKYNLKIFTIKDLIAYRFRNEILVEKIVTANLPTKYGDFQISVFRNKIDGTEHQAITKGEWKEDDPVLVRMHSECLTGDTFGSLRCDCGDQLHRAMEMIADEGKGVVVYMRQEGRGIGLVNKLKAYQLQDGGMDTVEANIALGFPPDARDYGIGAQILVSLGVRKMRLLTNNPKKRVGLESYGLEVSELVPIEVQPNPINYKYLKTKRDKLGHFLHNLDIE